MTEVTAKMEEMTLQIEKRTKMQGNITDPKYHKAKHFPLELGKLLFNSWILQT